MSAPLPNDRKDGAIVIASVFYSDIRDREEWAALLLHPEPPHYECILLDADNGDIIERGARHWNIVTATEEWQNQWGGDF